jgi:hypothetical protein
VFVSHTDFYSSFAAMTSQQLEPEEAPDSMDVLAALLGTSQRGRDELVVEGVQTKTVLRWKDWAYIPPHEGPAVNAHTHTELGNSPEPQLYDLSVDIGQIRNLAAEREDMVRALSARLDEIHRSSQTRPAP